MGGQSAKSQKTTYGGGGGGPATTKVNQKGAKPYNKNTPLSEDDYNDLYEYSDDDDDEVNGGDEDDDEEIFPFDDS